MLANNEGYESWVNIMRNNKEIISFFSCNTMEQINRASYQLAVLDKAEPQYDAEWAVNKHWNNFQAQVEHKKSHYSRKKCFRTKGKEVVTPTAVSRALLINSTSYLMRRRNANLDLKRP